MCQHRRVVVEQREIVHVAQIPRRAQHLLDEVVQTVQVHVRKELARQVADG